MIGRFTFSSIAFWFWSDSSCFAVVVVEVAVNFVLFLLLEKRNCEQN